MYDSLCTEFFGRPVIDFETSDSWQGTDVAYRLREEYEDETPISERLDALLAQPDVNRLSALIVGAWSGACEGQGSAEIIKKLAASAPRLSGLRALFFGEMTYEECEISWIVQSDVAPLLQAFPRLEVLRIRGGSGLQISRTRHESLRELAIETGGLPRSVIRELFLCEFPNLEHLELLLGEPNYGFDGGIEDLQPLLSGRLFPGLRFLGLMNSDRANEIAAVVVNAPILARIESLDLSMGNLDGEGVRSLMGLSDASNLKRLNISHHYASDEEVAQLADALSCEVIADERCDPEDEWRPIVHAE